MPEQKSSSDEDKSEVKKGSFNVNLLKGSVNIDDESKVFKLVVMIIAAAFLIGMIWALHEWAMPTLLLNNLTDIKWLEFLKSGKGRSP